MLSVFLKVFSFLVWQLIVCTCTCISVPFPLSFAAMSHMRITAATGFLSLVREGGCMEYVTMEHFQLLTKITSVSRMDTDN